MADDRGASREEAMAFRKAFDSVPDNTGDKSA